MTRWWRRLLFLLRVRCDRCPCTHVDEDGCFDCDYLGTK